MTNKLLAIFVLLTGSLASAQSYAPILQPHQFYVNSSGNPCAGCSLYSYAAGTTNPQNTYSDSTGDVNTNPVVLDATGSASIWLASVFTYKFILKDTNGTTLWTVDNVPGSSGGSSAPTLGNVIPESANFNAACGTNVGYAATATITATLPAYTNACLIPFSVVGNQTALTIQSPTANIVDECTGSLVSSIQMLSPQQRRIWSNGLNWEATCPGNQPGVNCGLYPTLSACLASSTSTGGEFRVPPGTYALGNTGLSIASGTDSVSILGSGPDNTTITYTGNGCAVSIGDGNNPTYHPQLKNVTINLTNAGSGAVGVCLTRAWWPEMDNVYVVSGSGASSTNGQTAFLFNGTVSSFSPHGVLTNLHLNGDFTSGIVLENNCNNLTFVGGAIDNATSAAVTGSVGINVTSSGLNRFIGLDISGWDRGVYDNSSGNYYEDRWELGTNNTDWYADTSSQGAFFIGDWAAHTDNGTFTQWLSLYANGGISDANLENLAVGASGGVSTFTLGSTSTSSHAKLYGGDAPYTFSQRDGTNAQQTWIYGSYAPPNSYGLSLSGNASGGNPGVVPFGDGSFTNLDLYLSGLGTGNVDLGPDAHITPSGEGVFAAGVAAGSGAIMTSTGLTCSMSSGTTCTVTVPTGSAHCAAYAQGATAYYAACGISSTTATVTANASNSATWLVIATE